MALANSVTVHKVKMVRSTSLTERIASLKLTLPNKCRRKLPGQDGNECNRTVSKILSAESKCSGHYNQQDVPSSYRRPTSCDFIMAERPLHIRIWHSRPESMLLPKSFTSILSSQVPTWSRALAMAKGSTFPWTGKKRQSISTGYGSDWLCLDDAQ